MRVLSARWPIPSLVKAVFAFAVGAVVVTALAALIRGGLTALVESRAHRLDRWRRPWFQPEREVASFFHALLTLSFLNTFAAHYGFSTWFTVVLFVLWALHLPADGWSWLRLRRRPQGTLQLHRRGFLLLDLGPLWLRGVVAALSAAVYLVAGPLRLALDACFRFLLALLRHHV
jgi:hypothetical protein